MSSAREVVDRRPAGATSSPLRRSRHSLLRRRWKVFEWVLSISSGRAARLLLHHLLHPLLHFLRRGVRLVCSHHPGVAIRVDNRAATISPEHVHDRALAGTAHL